MSLAGVKRELLELELGLIDEPDLPSRSMMDEKLLDELTDSIRADGLIQPISVARRGDRFMVLAGHRRTIACRRIGMPRVPAVVYPEGTTQLPRVQFAENKYRENLNPADEAIWFNEKLEQDCGGDVDRLVNEIGSTRSYVEGRLLLFQGAREVFEALQEEQITIGVAHQLNKCTDHGERMRLFHHAMTGGAPVAVVTSWIADWKKEAARLAGVPQAPIVPYTSGAIPHMNSFVCVCCGGSENVHMMTHVNVHLSCKDAILDKLITAYRGG